MPELSRFLGIIIVMYYHDHDPPHFHARYGSAEAVFAVSDLRIASGKLPQRVVSLVIEWAFKYRPELEENWQRCRENKPTKKIAPLE